MTSSDGKNTTARRAHDSEASRRALLEAARALFDELGYDRATTREIGERAAVDPAMIARYFGGKEGLFMAVIAEGPVGPGVGEIDFEPHALIAFLLRRWDERGPSPVSRALAAPTLSDEIREQVRAVLADLLIDPLVQELGPGGVVQPELRAELLVALAFGVALTRANGTLTGLATLPCADVIAVLDPVIDSIASGRS